MNTKKAAATASRRVVPSTVLALVNALPPGTQTVNQAPHLAAIVSLARQLYPAQLPEDPEAYANFFKAIEVLDYAVGRFISGGNVDVSLNIGSASAVDLLKDALSKSVDTPVSTKEDALAFMTKKVDKALRETIQEDINSAESAFDNSEWKPAAVIAGSVVEALLLWRIEQATVANIKVATAAAEKVLAKGNFHGDRTRWTLEQYAETAHQLKVISDVAKKAVDLARDFRNFIHPGRLVRTGEKCDRGAARIALGAVDTLIREFG